jgi:hypothetical protein
MLGNRSVLGAINDHLNPFRSRRALLECGLPLYDLRIKPAEYRKIQRVVELARQRGKLTEDLKQWAEAKFVFEGKARDVRIRVRGDGAEHWTGHRCSWRIRFPKDQPFMGQREINLVVSSDGKAVTERFTNAVFRRLGLITLRDGYAVLRINGIPQGVYYQVEHWDAPLLADRNRPETTIFRNPGGGRDLGSFEEQVTAGNSAAWSALQILLDYENHATSERLQAALAVTDLDHYVRFLAGTTLFCADHTSFVTDNHRLYFDDSLGRFFRIPWDLEPQRIPKVERFDLADWHSTFDVFARWPMSRFQIAVLQDARLRLRRDRVLWELVRDDSLLKLFDEVYRNMDVAFWSDVHGRNDEEERLITFRRLVDHNLRIIRGALSGGRTDLTVRCLTPERADLEFAVQHAAGVYLRAVRMEDQLPGTRIALYRETNPDPADGAVETKLADGTAAANGRIALLFTDEFLATDTGLVEDHPAYLYQSESAADRYKTKPLRTVVYPRTRRVTYRLTRTVAGDAGPSEWPAVEVDLVNAVTGLLLEPSRVHVRRLPESDRFDPSLRTRDVAAFIAAHPSFRIARAAEAARGVVLDEGTHRLEGTVIVPQGVTLIVKPGARLEMGAMASLLSFGPILAEGFEEAPIHIVAAGDEPWGVVAAVDAGGESRLRHVEVRGGGRLEGVRVNGIFFTGAVAVHQGDARIESCRFVGCTGEDAVNLKNGRVAVQDSLFADNPSDGLDLDFVEGNVKGCHFADNRGDGLDLCGSRVGVESCRMEANGDKGLSVGERSEASVRDTLLLKNVIGIAVKDRSQAVFEHCTLVGNETAVSAYCKKPIFGGGDARLLTCVVLDNATTATADADSTLRFSDCVGAAWGNVSAGLSAAPSEWSDLLPRSDYVLTSELAGSSGRNAGADGAAPPGIRTPPATLR